MLCAQSALNGEAYVNNLSSSRISYFLCFYYYSVDSSGVYGNLSAHGFAALQRHPPTGAVPFQLRSPKLHPLVLFVSGLFFIFFVRASCSLNKLLCRAGCRGNNPSNPFWGYRLATAAGVGTSKKSSVERFAKGFSFC